LLIWRATQQLNYRKNKIHEKYNVALKLSVKSMILKSLRVQNYKSIEDSNEFSIEPITCLVGKNESGKSAILQALYKLNPDISEKGDFDGLLEYPRQRWSEYKERHNENPDDVLTTIWELDEKEIEELSSIIGSKTLKDNFVTIKKGYDNTLDWNMNIDEKKVVEFFLESANLINEELENLTKIKSFCEIWDELETNSSSSQGQSELLEKIKTTFPDKEIMAELIKLLEPKLPTFLYFSEYQKLPGQVAINEFIQKKQKNTLEFSDRIFISLLALAGTKPEDIQTIGKYEELVAELEAVSNSLSKTIFKYWSQNRHLRVEFKFDEARSQDKPPYNSGYIFRTRIRNERRGVTVSFDDRSAGFVWFFSFLVWLSQLKRNYGKNLFILLDEPGLSLHGKAQADLLKYFNDELKPNYQVLYTTHSPFMIDPDNLLSVRTVEDVVSDDEIKGTKVGDKVLSTDADTIFPLQAALGYDITQTLFIGKHTLLVEGPSDLLYLKWFSNELKNRRRTYLDSKWTITPCGGIDKIGSFNALFRGNNLEIAVLTDFALGQKRKIRDLKESTLLKKGRVFSAEMYTDQVEADIEDMLGRSFYISLVNKCYSLENSYAVPIEKPIDVPIRVLKEVENHFALLPHDKFPEFDHYVPASFIIENTPELRTNLHDLDLALDRFERLFKDINGLLM
jgi:predicted ATP-dependent endonuclease of OLD family